MLTTRSKLIGALGVVFLSSSPVYSGKPFLTEDNAGATSSQNFPSRIRTATTRIVSETLEEQRVETGGNISRETTSSTTTSVTERTSMTQTNSAEGGQQRPPYVHNSQSSGSYQTSPEKND